MIARGGYTFSQVKEMSREEIAYIHYHQTLVDEKQMRTLLKALGVVWDKSDFLRSSSEAESSEDVAPDIYIPLAMTINPNLHKFVSEKSTKSTSNTVSKHYGDGELIESNLGKVRSMAELSKEDFYKMIGKPIPSKLKKMQEGT